MGLTGFASVCVAIAGSVRINGTAGVLITAWVMAAAFVHRASRSLLLSTGSNIPSHL